VSSDFVFLSTISWDDSDGAHRPVQFARELMRRGHRVLFVQVPPSRTRPTGSLLTLRPLPELGLTEREARYAWFGREPEGLGYTTERLAQQLDAFANPEAEQRVVIWCAPYIPFVQWLPLFQARGFLKVYDSLDDFEGLIQLGSFYTSVEAEKFLVRHCDLMLAVSPPLVDKLGALAPDAEVHLLRSGFDARLFSSGAMTPDLPSDLARGDCTLGFWGTIAEWTIDVNALEYVARARPNWVINLIGAVDPEPGHSPVATRLRAVPNVRLLGRVAHHCLPQYLAGFDVCLIPFTRNAFNTSREPLKLYEYLAGFKPVVALNTPGLEEMPAVYLAAAREEFLEQIERARAAPVDRGAVSDYLAGCTWQARTDELLRLIQEKKAHPFDSILELPSFYPEPDLPPNWRVYIAHLDQLLDERTAYAAQMEHEWQATQAYIKKLERTHPLVWLKRLIRRR
jgi:glycosyltransferase involved in cell wall biosynthesis